MFARFRKTAETKVTAHIPDGQRVYCIGDIHGCADLLLELQTRVMQDASGYRGNKTIVYLGDYIDRGDDSKQVIDILLSQPQADIHSVYLKGNHEQAMLDFMIDPQATVSWLAYGGRETLNSYGIAVGHIPTKRELPLLAEKLHRQLPDSHKLFLQDGLLSWQCGSYYFVHAGIRPGVALEKQRPEDQMWIRGEFLQSNKNHGAIIVHGHSITMEVELLSNRIGIDTGAFATGILSCLVLEGNEQRLLQTSADT